MVLPSGEPTALVTEPSGIKPKARSSLTTRRVSARPAASPDQSLPTLLTRSEPAHVHFKDEGVEARSLSARAASHGSAISEPDSEPAAIGLQPDSKLSELKKLLGKNDDQPLKGKDLVAFLNTSGLLDDDPRIKQSLDKLKCWDELSDRQATILLDHTLIRKALHNSLSIQDFPAFSEILKNIYASVASNTGGKVADYIPKLANQNPDNWAASVCSVDGQRFSLGDADVPFSAQSSSKPITYGLALETRGEHFVHQHVGKEPSGRNFNARTLLQREGKKAIPHNPCINAGAIMSASLVKMDSTEWERFEYMIGIWEKLCGGHSIGFQYDTFCGERATAARNFCLAYMMEEEKAFPHGTDLNKTLEAYFSWCSIEVTCRAMAVLAGTLANGGVCPTTLERIFTHETVTHMLSIMMGCGMYDFSGQFAFEFGFPAKSGVSGVTLIVIPGVCGMVTFSPRLDSIGNSVRGIEFCRQLSSCLPFHVFGRLKGLVDENGMSCESSPPGSAQVKMRQASAHEGGQQSEMKHTDRDEDEISSLLWSAERGDCQRIRQLALRAVDLNSADYDKRTALHVAASAGQQQTVRLLLALNADMHALDIHGNTPLDDATREQKNGAKRALQRAACTVSSRTPQRLHKLASSRKSLMTYFADMTVKDQHLGCEHIPRSLLIDTLGEYGFQVEVDSRLSELESLPNSLSGDDLSTIAEKLPLLQRALEGHLAVPNFGPFCDKFEELFDVMCSEGEHAEYSEGDETLDLMTVDGQRLHLGRTKQSVTLDEFSSLVVFVATAELLDTPSISHLVGNEPSGENNSSPIVNADGIPYNPFMWNGMLSLLARLQETRKDAWSEILEVWVRLSGQTHIVHNDAWEAEDRKRYYHDVSALVHTLIAKGTLAPTTKTDVVVSHFFRLRSLVAYNQELSGTAALLGNGGVNVFTGERVLPARTVKDVLTLMFTTGCGSMSGELSFRLGVPAHSTAVGALLLVVPNLLGICIFGRAVNNAGVSLAALKLCTDIGVEFHFHALAGSCTKSAKLDPSLYHFQTDIELCENLLWAASKGDLSTLVYLRNLGFNLNCMDYDLRSATHLAAAHGQMKALRYLHKHGAEIDVKDRWGNMPLDDAKRNGHQEVAKALHRWMSKPDSTNSPRARTPSVCESTISTYSGGKALKAERTNAPVAARKTFQRSHKSFDALLDAVFEGSEPLAVEEDENEKESDRKTREDDADTESDSGSI